MKKKYLALLFPLILGIAVVLVAPVAAHAVTCIDSKVASGQQIKLGVPLLSGQGDCIDNTAEGGAIVAYIKVFLQFLSGGVGLVIVLSLVIAGIQYLIAGGNPAMVAKAKDRITNAIMALVLFILGFAILSFIIPGGIISV